MFTNLKKSALRGAIFAAAAAPAVLVLGAGTAHAGGHIWNNADYLGTTVFVESDGDTYGDCTYDAAPVHGPGIPPAPQRFFLVPKETAQLWFPGVKLNTTWFVRVTCSSGPDILDYTVY
jgi:hypothetical protein